MDFDPEHWSIPDRYQPKPGDFTFDLVWASFATVSLQASVPADAFTAGILGTDRIGYCVAIDAEGTVLTIGYLITEAEEVWLTTGDGDAIQAHVLGVDNATGFGLVKAVRPLPVPALEIGNSQEAGLGDKVVIAAGGRIDRSIAAQVVARQEFAGYWEYVLDEAIFTSPAHPLWSGAAMIGASGKLLGICSLQMREELESGGVVPLNMVVPIELLPPILEELKAGGRTAAPRPWLGLLAGDSSGKVVVLGATPGGPAHRAELREGDVILGVAGKDVPTLAQFYRAVWALGDAGVKAPLTVQREGDVFDVTITTRDRNSFLKKPILH